MDSIFNVYNPQSHYFKKVFLLAGFQPLGMQSLGSGFLQKSK